MDLKDAESLLGDIQFGDVAGAQSDVLGNVAPSPTAPSFLGRMTPAKAEEQFRQANVSGTVPLDIESGVGPWEKLMLDMRSNRENQMKYLESKYGPNTVRFSTDGELIVRVPDQENKGQQKDLLVRPHSMKATDFIDLLATVPEIAMSIYAMRKGQAIPWLGKKTGATGLVRDALAATVGGEVVGAGKDIIANVYDKSTPELAQTLQERAKRIPGMTAIGAVGGSLPALWRTVKNPLAGSMGQVQFDLSAARDYWRGRMPGWDMPLSVGQATGAPIAGRSEVFIEKMPGGSGPVRDIFKRQETSLRQLQDLLLGTSLPSEEELGTRAMAQLQPVAEGVGATTDAARAALAKTAQDAIESKVATLTSPAQELYHEQTGKAIRDAIIGKRDAAKSEADRLYGIVRSLPGGDAKIFDGANLQSDLRQILGKPPSPQQTVMTPTGPVSFTQPLKDWTPPDLLGRIKEVVNLQNPKFSLSDLQQMRRDVYDAIGFGEGVPGLQTHYLSQIGKTITKAIDDAVKSMPTSDLKDALQAANKHYRENVVPFNRKGLTELFQTPMDKGYVADENVVRKVFSGKEPIYTWNLLKQTLGTSSPEFDRLKRSVADMILENSRVPGETTLDAKSLVKNIYDFKKDNRAIADDVFSKQENELFRQARFLKYAEGDKLNEAELRKLMASGSTTAADLQRLIYAERQQDTLYKNQIMKAVGDGTLNPATLQPSEFLNRMIDNPKVGVSEVGQVMGYLRGNPTLVEDIKRKTFEKLFRDSARQATAQDVNLIMAGKPTHIVSGVKIGQALKNSDFKKKIETILGPDSYKDLDQYVKLQSGLDVPEQSFSAAGGLAAGTQIAKAERILEQGGILAYGSNVARSFLFSYVLSNPASRAWLTHVPDDPWAATAFLHTLVSTPAFLEAVSREFPKTPGLQFVHNLKATLDKSVRAKQQEPQRGPIISPVRNWDEYLNQP